MTTFKIGAAYFRDAEQVREEAPRPRHEPFFMRDEDREELTSALDSGNRPKRRLVLELLRENRNLRSAWDASRRTSGQYAQWFEEAKERAKAAEAETYTARQQLRLIADAFARLDNAHDQFFSAWTGLEDAMQEDAEPPANVFKTTDEDDEDEDDEE